MSTSNVSLLQRYRLLPWGGKFANSRLILYALLGYALAGGGKISLLAANTLAILGLIAFQGIFNDFWDFRLAGERNCFGQQIANNKEHAIRIIWHCMLPLIFVLPALFYLHQASAPTLVGLFFLAGLLLSIVYSAPPLRLKTRKPWGILIAPALTTLIFLESYWVLATPSPVVWQLALLLGCFQLYAELLHVVGEGPKAAAKFSPLAAAVIVRWLPAGSGAVSLIFAVRQPIFWLGVLGAAARLKSIRSRKFGELIEHRHSNFWNPLYAVFEFIGYGMYGLLRATLAAALIICLLAPDIASAQSFARAIEPRVFVFPQDHAAHPEFQTEWWHLVGAFKQSSDAPATGLQATWFQTIDIKQELAPRRYVFHAAMTQEQLHPVFQDACDAGNEEPCGVLSDAQANTVIQVKGSQLVIKADGTFQARFMLEGSVFDLQLSPQRKPWVAGAGTGLRRKGMQPGEASYHISIPRLEASGTMVGPDGRAVPINGQFWLDHEFGSQQLGSAITGWDWFSAIFDDGTELAVYSLREGSKPVSQLTDAVLFLTGGQVVEAAGDAIVLSPSDFWQSEATGARYPLTWRVQIASMELDLQINALANDQEVDARNTTQTVYWEGLCSIEGTRAGQSVSGTAYMELVGYGSPEPAI